MKALFLTLLALFAAVGRADAEVPLVVTDIAPVHSLVAQVMEGVGQPELLLPPGASPHGYALRPSEARALSDANLVFWIGPGLTPWLERALGTLATGATKVPLGAAPGIQTLAYREGPAFGQSHEDEEQHEHGATDPHIWLDPVNAQAIVDLVAGQLAQADPENAPVYRANAARVRDRLSALTAEIELRIAPHRARPFIVFHDAYHYFETRFGIEAAGALAESDAADPGPARVAALRDAARRLGVVCMFAEPQFDPRLFRAVTEGAGVKSGVLDPMGSGVAPGPELYATLLMDLAENMATCLSVATE